MTAEVYVHMWDKMQKPSRQRDQSLLFQSQICRKKSEKQNQNMFNSKIN